MPPEIGNGSADLAECELRAAVLFKMAGESSRSQSLKEALFESLTAVLSPVQEIRAAGEEQVKALEVTEGVGLVLGCSL